MSKVGGVAKSRSVGEGSSDAGGIVEDTKGELLVEGRSPEEVEEGREDRDDDEEVELGLGFMAEITRRLGSVQSVSILLRVSECKLSRQRESEREKESS